MHVAGQTDMTRFLQARQGMQTDTFHHLSTIVLGVGSLAFGAWAVARPAAFAAFMGSDPAMGRMTGVRDLVIGSAILRRRDPTAFAMRALADVWDASTVRRSRVATGALGFSLWAGAAAASATRSTTDHTQEAR